MNSNVHTAAPAIPTADDSLTILRDVSHIYETLKVLRKRAARVAHNDGATYQALSDALGINRSGAFNLIKKDAA
jgi:hypothetical protein